VTVTPGYVRLKHSDRRARSGARLVGPANPDEPVSVSVRVRRRSNASALPSAVARGRGVLSRREFAERFGAAERDLLQVAAFARSYGLSVTEESVPRRTLVLCGTVGQASRAFGVELGRYEAGEETYRGHEGSVYVPAHLFAIIEGVFGLDNRQMARRGGATVTLEQETIALTPPEVAALYDFPTGIDASGQTIGLIEFTSDVDPLSGYQPSDINAFFAKLGLPTPNLTDVGVDGAVNPGIDPRDLAMFAGVVCDIDVAGSVAPGASIAVYFAPGTEQGWVDVISTAVHDANNTPSVLAIAWGWAEREWSRAAIDAVSATFQEAAQLGLTVLASSGNGGSPGWMEDGLAHVFYPASDPFVTSCGGTLIWDVSDSSPSEMTWRDFAVVPFEATGGGVSDIFDPPAWQAWAGVPASVNGNGRVGRGVPDVAGHGGNYAVVWDGATALSSGGPDVVPSLYAGLVSLINSALGEPVGYLNPDLYTFAQGYVFRDINDGFDNSVDPSFSTASGYIAGPGWDACTGLGSIDGNALLMSVRGLGLPPALAQLTTETLHMAWKGLEFDDTIWWSTFDGTNWASQQQVPGVLTSTGVTMAEFNGRLFMAWKGSFTDGTPFDERIWWTTFDGSKWARQREVPGVRTSAGPQLGGPRRPLVHDLEGRIRRRKPVVDDVRRQQMGAAAANSRSRHQRGSRPDRVRGSPVRRMERHRRRPKPVVVELRWIHLGSPATDPRSSEQSRPVTLCLPESPIRGVEGLVRRSRHLLVELRRGKLGSPAADSRRRHQPRSWSHHLQRHPLRVLERFVRRPGHLLVQLRRRDLGSPTERTERRHKP
jgi:Pro-kumamolisin, activation domain